MKKYFVLICLLASWSCFAFPPTPSNTGATTITDIGDATADTETNLGNYKIVWPSTLNSAGVVFSIKNTVADLTADVSLLDCLFYDDGDTNAFCARGYDHAYNDLKWYIKGDGSAYFDSISVLNGLTVLKTSGVAGLMTLFEANSTDTSYIGDLGPDSIAESYSIKKSSTQPTTGMIKTFTTPSGSGDPNGNKTSDESFVWPGGALPVVTDDADNFAANFTGKNLYGGTFRTNGAGTGALPAPACLSTDFCMNFTVTDAGATPTMEPLATGTDDTIIYNETSCGQGVSLVSDGTTGSMAVFQYGGADTWIVYGNGFACGS